MSWSGPLRKLMGTGRIVKASMLAAFAIVLLSVVAAGGCNSKSTTPGAGASPTPIPSGSPTPTPSPTPTANYFVGLDYPSIPPTTDPTYGEIQGYAALSKYPLASPSPSTSPSPIPTISSQLVTVHCDQNIQFYNLDKTAAHTASSLGPANGMNWPPTFNNPNGTVASPLLTPISYQSFSSGALGAYSAAGWYSLVYSTGSTAGSYYFGDYYDYNPVFAGYPSMRTVITVLCP
jgi:hypothetical protein